MFKVEVADDNVTHDDNEEVLGIEEQYCGDEEDIIDFEKQYMFVQRK